MDDIKNNLDTILNQICETANQSSREADSVKLIAVSKKKNAHTVMEAVKAGVLNFGENYIQEAVKKIETISDNNLTWHFIGHLQSNKAKLAVKYFEYIHTVDTVKLAKEINKQAGKLNKIQKILLQVNIGDEVTKSGTRIEDSIELVENIHLFDNISVEGLMCMPPYFSDPEKARVYFRQLVKIKQEIEDRDFKTVSMRHLSMGMSSDFKVAIEEGSTMVRVGTSIFGQRN